MSRRGLERRRELGGGGQAGGQRGPSVTKALRVGVSSGCRMIRMRQTGKNHNNNNHLLLAGFEIFGDLVE